LPPASESLGLRRLTATVSRETDEFLVVLDDIDLLPTSIERFGSHPVSLLLVTKEKRVPVLITSQRVFPQRLARRLSAVALASLQVPAMSLQEIRDYCAQEGCQVPEIDLIAIQILAKTSGHPILVHAVIIHLTERGGDKALDSLAAGNADVLEGERAETRQLLSGLPENSRELVYRLSLIEDPVSQGPCLKDW
jgi:hypothetical protein